MVRKISVVWIQRNGGSNPNLLLPITALSKLFTFSEPHFPYLKMGTNNVPQIGVIYRNRGLRIYKSLAHRRSVLNTSPLLCCLRADQGSTFTFATYFLCDVDQLPPFLAAPVFSCVNDYVRCESYIVSASQVKVKMIMHVKSTFNSKLQHQEASKSHLIYHLLYIRWSWP